MAQQKIRQSGSLSLRALRPLCAGVLAAAALLGVSGPHSSAQQTTPVYSPPSLSHHGGLGEAAENPNTISPINLEKLRETERHKRLLQDTARLMELTSQLKADVEKSSKDELSLDVVRRAAEIEKLARDVKDRMRN